MFSPPFPKGSFKTPGIKRVFVLLKFYVAGNDAPLPVFCKKTVLPIYATGLFQKPILPDISKTIVLQLLHSNQWPVT